MKVKLKVVLCLFALFIVVCLAASAGILVMCWKHEDAVPETYCVTEYEYRDWYNQPDCDSYIKLSLGSDEKPVLLFLSAICDKVTVRYEEYPFTSYLKGEYRDRSVEYNIRADWLYKELEKLIQPSTDAYIEFGDEDVHIVPEKVGRSIDIANAVATILCYHQFNGTVDISSCVVKDCITEADLQSEFEKVSWLNEWHMSWSDGTTVSYPDIIDTYLCDTEPDWDGVISELSESYTTTDDSLYFTTSGGDTLSVEHYTFGYTLDKESELEFIKSCYNQRVSCEGRVPVLKGYGDFEDTYVEVSIADQHVWHYVDGILCCETDTVTGTKGKHDTPHGVFYISERIDGKYLRGDDYVTWVDKWMRITNSGHGLHDAYWRDSFGGNIYTYNGSHGCINLPPTYAYSLFDEVKVGTPVVIY